MKKCESCGKEIQKDDQIAGQYNNVCFKCWDTGNFKTDSADINRRYRTWKQLKNR